MQSDIKAKREFAQIQNEVGLEQMSAVFKPAKRELEPILENLKDDVSLQTRLVNSEKMMMQGGAPENPDAVETKK